MLDLRYLKWDSHIKSGGSVGMLPKTTVLLEGVNYYVKMSSYNIAHGVYGMESICEVIASRVARILGIDSIDSFLIEAIINKDGKDFTTHLCMSQDYNPNKIPILPFEDWFVGYRQGVESPLNTLRRYGIQGYIYQMFAYDYIINNLDRHGANIEIFRDTLSFVPLFDNGNSLYCVTPDDLLLTAYKDDNIVNNFIGSRSLLDNIYEIDEPIYLGTLDDSHFSYIFEGLEHLITEERQSAIWKLISRRYENVRDLCNIE